MVKPLEATKQVKCRDCEHLDRDRDHWKYKQGQCLSKLVDKWPEQPRCCREFEQWKKED